MYMYQWQKCQLQVQLLAQFLNKQNQKQAKLNNSNNHNNNNNDHNNNSNNNKSLLAKDKVHIFYYIIHSIKSTPIKELKRKTTGDQHIETNKMSVQYHISMSPQSTVHASVQTDHYDVMTGFWQQILNKTEVVKQLTALKCLHQHEPKPAALLLYDEDSDFPTLDSESKFNLNFTLLSTWIF